MTADLGIVDGVVLEALDGEAAEQPRVSRVGDVVEAPQPRPGLVGFDQQPTTAGDVG